MEKRKWLSPAQLGGQYEASTVDHVFVVNNIIRRAMYWKEKINIGIFDMEKAYDKGDPRITWEILKNSKIKGKIIEIIKKSTENNEIIITINNKERSEIQCKNNIKQGGVFSSLIFSLIIDQLGIELNKRRLIYRIEKLKFPHPLWIDDLLTMNRDGKQTKKMLRVNQKMQRKLKIKFNEKKCKMMEINRNNKKKTKYQLNKKNLEEVKKMKYLGMIINNKGNFKDDIQYKMININAAFFKLLKTLEHFEKNTIKTNVVTMLYKTLVQSLYTYGTEAYVNLTKTEKEKLEKLNLRHIKILFNLPRSTKRETIYYETGTTSIEEMRNKRRINYLHKIINSKKNSSVNKIYRIMKKEKLEKSWYTEIRKEVKEYKIKYEMVKKNEYETVEAICQQKNQYQEKGNNS